MKKTLCVIAILFAIILPIHAFASSTSSALSGSTSSAAGGNAAATANGGDAAASQINAPAATIGNIGSNNVSEATPRYFITPGNVNYPGAPENFAPLTNIDGYLRIPMATVLAAIGEDGFVSRETIDSLADEQLTGTKVIVNPFFKNLKDSGAKGLKVILNVKPAGFKSLGMITTLSTSTSVNAPAVMGDLFKRALAMGANTIVVIKEGGHLLTRNGGYGVGIAFTGATIGNGTQQAATGVVGAGAAWGWVGYFDHPYIEAVIGIIEK
jgi:hypothetical protein